MTPKGDGMPPQEQEEGACDCPFHREPEWREPECDCGSGYAHRRADCTVPKPSPAVEEGPAGGEARCLDDLTYSKGYQRGLEAGEKGMRERAALLVWPSYAAAIRALPLSVADGPAPAKEEGSSFPSKAEFTETYFKSPAPSPPTAEERVEKEHDCPTVDPPCAACVAEWEARDAERAALLACREALRTATYQLNPDTDTWRECWKALAAADAVK